jgi:hypothetical protein
MPIIHAGEFRAIGTARTSLGVARPTSRVTVSRATAFMMEQAAATAAP